MNTRQIIVDAAYRLFETKHFDRITIQNILDEACISRKTFYKYFKDKYELMYMYYTSYVEENILSNYDGSNWCETQALFFDFVRKKHHFFTNISDIKGDENFWNFLYQYTYHFYEKVRLKNTHKAKLTEIEHYTIHAIANSDISVLRAYINDKSTLPPLELSRLLCKMIPRDYQCCEDW